MRTSPTTLLNYNLRIVNPAIAKEWHPTKNGKLAPRDVTPGSGKKVWWKCKKGHEWETITCHRTRGRGCPYCSGRMACKDNCLKTLRPDLAKEWHPTKNGKLTPGDVIPGSSKKVWWRCKKGHEWQAMIFNRNEDKGCPYCNGKLACKENCLQTVNPTLAEEWHPTMNGNLTPRDVTPNSNKKVWWRCSWYHEWKAIVCSRNSGGHGCPYCWAKIQKGLMKH